MPATLQTPGMILQQQQQQQPATSANNTSKMNGYMSKGTHIMIDMANVSRVKKIVFSVE